MLFATAVALAAQFIMLLGFTTRETALAVYCAGTIRTNQMQAFVIERQAEAIQALQLKAMNR